MTKKEAVEYAQKHAEEREEKQRLLMETILPKFDGVYATHVYIGGLGNLINVMDELEWNTREDYEEYGIDGRYLSLREISEQVTSKHPKSMITVFFEEPLSGKIYQYGNYGDSWFELGTMRGYA